MPNWTSNKVFFKTENKAEMDAILHSLGGKNYEGCEQPFTFHKFVPMPQEVIDTIPAPEEHNGLRVMSDEEYEWCYRHWGTKWDACYVEIVRKDDTHAILYFDTAWCTPIPVAEAMREQFGDSLVSWVFLDEGDTEVPEFFNTLVESGFDYEDLEFAETEVWQSLF